MTVWTISAQAGTPSLEVAAELSGRAGVPLFDRKALEPIVHELSPELGELGDLDSVERRFGGRLNALALAAAMTYAAPEAFREFELRRTLPGLGRRVMAEVARHPAVILAAAAASALADHPGAVHARLWAPKEWRAAAYSRAELVDREKAAREVAHADHVERTWVHALFDVRVDDPTLYTVALDASRLPVDRIVGVLLAAGDAT
ncbi:MAG TPA: cytidylate kinase family protein [Gaiellaceae bacterium]|nr:cytidylate kinase family protein [Gaiellaceae bacterium]